MSLQHIEVAVDPEQTAKGDVVIIKRSFWNAKDGRLETRCTHCGKVFKTELRRMERLYSYGKRQVEVRNIPQCPTCRSRYRKEKAAQAKLQKALPPALPRIEDWCIVGGRLHGIVSGRAPFLDGHRILTSLIVDGPRADGTCQTRHTLYALGAPAPTQLGAAS